MFLLHLMAFITFVTFAGSSSMVVPFEDEDFEEKLLDYDYILILFYSPECIHCENFLPIFEEIADDLRRNEPTIFVGSVNCLDSGQDTCKNEHLKKLPTLKVYYQGEVVEEYEDEYKREVIVNYMKKISGIMSQELKHAEIDTFLEGIKEISIVAFLPKNGTLREQYFNLPADLDKDLKFTHYNIKDNEESSRVLLRRPKYLSNKFEDDQITYTGKGYDLEMWLRTKKHGVVGLRTSSNFQEFESPLILAYYPIDVAKKPKIFSYWRNRILKVAHNYVSHFNFAVCDRAEFAAEFRKFGFEPNDNERPTIFAILTDNRKYLMDDEFSSENFELFLQGIRDDSVEVHMKSQPLPPHNSAPVKVAVAKNFKKLVLENGKDTLLVFYAPWCTHCRQFEEPLQKVAEQLIEEDVMIIKMDATANEIPSSFDLQGYPTVYWLPKHSKDSPRIFDGKRTADQLIRFISGHATQELKNYDRHGKSKSSVIELHEEL